MQKSHLLGCILVLALSTNCSNTTDTEVKKTEVTKLLEAQTKPWTRWWWMGSAVDSVNIKQNLIDLNNVGIGGVEIAPIYGVKGEEANFIDYLSPKWMGMLSYTTKVADSLGMGVDLTLGTGWPYGGPQVTTQFAATKLITQKYEVSKGETKTIEITVDNPKDKKSAKLNSVLAYGSNGDYQDITKIVSNNSFSFTVDADGSNPLITNVSIEGHPDASIIVVKENSSYVAQLYEGSYEGIDQNNDQGTFNAIVFNGAVYILSKSS